jgi:hypothetical protein
MNFEELMDEMNRYFAQLNQEEKYGWAAEGVGFVVIVVGIVFLF